MHTLCPRLCPSGRQEPNGLSVHCRTSAHHRPRGHMQGLGYDGAVSGWKEEPSDLETQYPKKDQEIA